MKVTVQLLSTLRDCLPQSDGKGQIELPDNATVADLITHLRIDKKLRQSPDEIAKSGAWTVMINDRIETDYAHTLNDGDSIQIFRWVAGG